MRSKSQILVKMLANMLVIPIANRTATNHLVTTITKFRNKIKKINNKSKKVHNKIKEGLQIDNKIKSSQ